MKRVTADGPSTVRTLLESVGVEADRAVAEGRVFAGARRVVDAGEVLSRGAVVEVGELRELAEPVVLRQSSDLVAVLKPAGVPTVPDRAGSEHALVARAAKVLDLPPDRLRVTSRLDLEVSGVVVFALDGLAEARLRAARDAGQYARRYLALAARAPGAETGTWDAPIGRAADPRLRAARGKDAKPSESTFRRLGALAGGAELLALEPRTGRTHQLRVHAADGGAPLLGDRAYGGPTRVTLPDGTVLGVPRVMLHAARVVVPDASGHPFEVVAPPAADFRALYRELGGADEAWENALA